MKISVSVIFPIAVFLFHSLSSGQFTSTGGPYGGAVTCLATIDDAVFAGTGKAGVYRSSDNGRHWTTMGAHENYQNSYIKSFAVAGSILYVAHSFGVYKSGDKGTTWETTASIGGFSDCLLQKDNLLFAGTNFSGMKVSNDSGKTWLPGNNGFPDLDSTRFAVDALACNEERIYAQTNKGLYVSDDNGSHWIRKDSLSSKGIDHFAIQGDTVFGANSRRLYVSVDDSSWTEITPPNQKTDNLTMFHSLMLNGNVIYAGMDSCRVAKSSDLGKHWDITHLPAPPHTFVYSLLVKDNAIFAGTSNGMFISDDDCVTWEAIDTGMVNSYVTSLIVRGSYLYASMLGTVAFSDDDGTTWKNASAGDAENPLQYIVEYDRHLLGITPDGCYLSDVNGTNWKKINSGTPPITCMEFTADRGMLYAGNEDTVYHSVDSGATWLPFDKLPGYTDIISAHDGTLYAGTTFDGLFAYDTADSEWINLYIDDEESSDISSLYFYENAIYIHSDGGLHRSTNGGTTWNNVFTELGGARITSWSMSDDDILLGATNVYKIYFYSGKKENWTEVRYGQQFNTLSCVLKNGFAFAGTDGGGVWRWSIPDSLATAVNDTGITRKQEVVETGFRLFYNDNTSVGFYLPAPVRVSVRITDLQGTKVYSHSKQYLVPGTYLLSWKADSFSPGMYLVYFQTGRVSLVRKLALLR